MSRALMVLTILAGVAVSVSGKPAHPGLGLNYINSITLDATTPVAETRVGGLSALVWDRKRNFYYAPADASHSGGARIYTLRLNWDKGKLANAEVMGVSRLRNRDGKPLPGADLEGAALSFSNTLWLANEPFPTSWLRAFDCRTGGQVGEIDLPASYFGNGQNTPGESTPSTQGLELNRGIESLTISPDGKRLWTATEMSLLQDRETLGTRVSRITRYSRKGLNWHPECERLYTIRARGMFNTTSEILALDERHLLILERRLKVPMARSQDFAFSLFLVDYDQPDATDVLAREARGNEARLKKIRLFDSVEAGIVEADNVEGMCLGPVVDGKQTLILVSDDNFRESQATRLHLLSFSISGEKDLLAGSLNPRNR